MTLKSFFSALLFVAVTQGSDLPKGEDIFDRFIDVTGGKAAYQTLKSQSIRAEIEFLGQGIRGLSSTVNVYPNRALTTMELAGLGKMYSGVWDGIVWESSAMQGQRLAQGEERNLMLRMNDLRAAADWRKYFNSVTTEGEESVEGKNCYRVISRPSDGGKSEISWFDKESGLIVRTKMILVSPMGEIPMEITVSDYRKVGPFLLPHLSIQAVGPQKISSRIQEIRIDPVIETSQLEPPAAIKSLIAKQKP